MEGKKNWKANLENFSSLFFLAGLAISLMLVTEVLQWQSLAIENKPEPPRQEVLNSGITIPRTWPEKPEIPEKTSEPEPVVKKLDPNRFKVVDNSTNTKARPTIDLAHIGLDSIVDEGSTDEDEPVLAILVENMARPKTCANLEGKDEQMACFNQWIANYLAQEIEYPSHLRNIGVEEKLYVEFVINEFGRVESVETKRGNEPQFIREAERVLRNMPEFEPARQFNRAVPVRVIIPVNFKIQ